jgi:hypothetical protein
MHHTSSLLSFNCVELVLIHTCSWLASLATLERHIALQCLPPLNVTLHCNAMQLAAAVYLCTQSLSVVICLTADKADKLTIKQSTALW